MSELKIYNLSFFEIIIDSSSQVKGGISGHYLPLYYHRYMPIFEEYEMDYIEESVMEDGSKRTFFYDTETDSSGVILSNETDRGKSMSGIVEGYFPDGEFKSAFSSTSSTV